MIAPQTGPVARITLEAIYAEVQGLRVDVVKIKSDLPHHVTITKDKQEEYEARLANHGSRLGDIEHRLTRLEGNQKPRTPWYSVVGGIAGIVASVATLITLITVASKLGATLG